MKMNKLVTVLAALVILAACDKKNDDLVMPLKDFPQVINFDDEGAGGLEDEDKFSFLLTCAEKKGKDVTVYFDIKELEGFENLADYVKGWKAFYAIDDCSESDDLPMEFDPVTGKGSVRFPAGAKELEVEFETDDSFFDDDAVNGDERSIAIVLTGIDAGKESIVINTAAEFKYEVLDDEAIYGDWQLDHQDPEIFAKFKDLFGIIHEDIATLSDDEVNKVEIRFEYKEINVVVELKETEIVTECGESEEINKSIEVEMETEELNADGDVETSGEIEQENGSVKEFTYKGKYAINGSALELTFQGEYDDNETEGITLILAK